MQTHNFLYSNVKNFWIVDKVVVTQAHTAVGGKFNIMIWRGLKWHNVFLSFEKLNKYFHSSQSHTHEHRHANDVTLYLVSFGEVKNLKHIFI